jgi:hypothetical protein
MLRYSRLGLASQWFHGHAGDSPSGVLTLVPGQTTVMDIACRKEHSLYGNPQATADACPQDPGAYHAGGTTCAEGDTSCNTLGWSGNTEGGLLGCALAIAYKSTAAETKPEDFIVMSIQPTCVRQRETPFEIPANLPACPEGGCTCAWFWSGKNSNPEMYMTGFRCDVEGGVVTDSYPTSEEPTKGSDLTGPTQPFYWANTLDNLGYEFPGGIEDKPTYNADYGWTLGAQTGAFAGVAGSSNTNTQTTNNVDPAAAVVAPVESGSAPEDEAAGSMTTMGDGPVVEPTATGQGEAEASIPTGSTPAAAPSSDLNLGGGQASVGVPGAEPTDSYDEDEDEASAVPDRPVTPTNTASAGGDPEYPAPSQTEAAAGRPTYVPTTPVGGNAAPTATGCGRGGRGHRWGPDQAERRSGHMEKRRSRARAAGLNGQTHV